MNARCEPIRLTIDAAAEAERIAGSLRAQVLKRLRRKGLVVGLSGGVDSSVVAALGVRAFGSGNVLGIFMPEQDSDPESLRLGREVAASLMGVNLVRTKLAAFVISSFLAGVGGALFGSYLSFVRPQSWDLILSISFVAMIIVGGIGTVWGPLLGAIFVAGTPTVLNHYADSVPFLQHGSSSGGLSITEFSSIFYGALIILFLVLEPRGVVGLAGRAIALAQRLARGPAIPPSTPLPSQQSA